MAEEMLSYSGQFVLDGRMTLAVPASTFPRVRARLRAHVAANFANFRG